MNRWHPQRGVLPDSGQIMAYQKPNNHPNLPIRGSKNHQEGRKTAKSTENEWVQNELSLNQVWTYSERIGFRAATCKAYPERPISTSFYPMLQHISCVLGHGFTIALPSGYHSFTMRLASFLHFILSNQHVTIDDLAFYLIKPAFYLIVLPSF